MVAHSRSKPANESLDLVWPIGALHAFWPCKPCLCENLTPFSKSEAKTPRLVSSDFDFSLEIKLVVCLKYGI